MVKLIFIQHAVSVYLFYGITFVSFSRNDRRCSERIGAPKMQPAATFDFSFARGSNKQRTLNLYMTDFGGCTCSLCHPLVRPLSCHRYVLVSSLFILNFLFSVENAAGTSICIYEIARRALNKFWSSFSNIYFSVFTSGNGYDARSNYIIMIFSVFKEFNRLSLQKRTRKSPARADRYRSVFWTVEFNACLRKVWRVN